MAQTNQFKMLRIKAHLSQRDVAKKLNVGKSAVSMWETGVRIPRSNKLKKIAGLFGVTVDFLLDDDNKDDIEISGKSRKEKK